MKVKCDRAVHIGDNKTKQPFTAGNVYDIEKIAGTTDEAYITGDTVRKNGEAKWQALKVHGADWCVIGLAKFSNVKE